MKQYPIFCGGEFISSQHEHQVYNKFNGEPLGLTYLADRAELDQAIVAAQGARQACAELSSADKFGILRFISDELSRRKPYLAEVLCRESGKPIRYALTEIERSVQTFLIAAEESKRLPREYMSLDWMPYGREREGLVRYFPIGLVAGISPFNFPMNLAVHKLAPAIAAGCPIVLKPASSTPLSTLELAEIIAKTNLPKGAVSILPMNRATGNLLVSDERLHLLSFTGSPVVGWELKKQSGRKKALLELGGNAGVIVSNNVDLHKIIERCLVGAFSYSGQICIHAQRFFVHREVYTAFLELMKQRTGQLATGDPLKPETEFSVMIDEENAQRVEQWVQEAIDDGARLVCGGRRKGSFFEATLLTNTTPAMKVNSEEVFGPVVCIEAYDGGIDNAVRLLNDSRFGLQCGVFTDSVTELDYVFRHAEVGGIVHNDVPTLRFDQMPYGGVKDSGLGREGVKYAIQDMLEPRILVK